jgi:hypothetical protein
VVTNSEMSGQGERQRNECQVCDERENECSVVTRQRMSVNGERTAKIVFKWRRTANECQVVTRTAKMSVQVVNDIEWVVTGW